MKSIIENGRQDTENDDFKTKYLTFRIDKQYYGISIANVIEILQLQPVTELPELPYYSKGIINLRGRVIPLIDVNLRFGKPENEYTDRTCIIIVDIDGLHTGLIVDAVEEVLAIDDRSTPKPPAFYRESSTDFLTGIAKLDKIMVLLLDIRLMLSIEPM